METNEPREVGPSEKGYGLTSFRIDKPFRHPCDTYGMCDKCKREDVRLEMGGGCFWCEDAEWGLDRADNEQEGA